MTNMHLYIDLNNDEIFSDQRKQLVINYNLDGDLKDCVSSVELHISDPTMETWPEVLREIIEALETLYGYEFDMERFEK
jgi:hypothetical protein